MCRALMKYRAGHGEERMSPLSAEYCRRARGYLAAIGSPLVQGAVPTIGRPEGPFAANKSIQLVHRPSLTMAKARLESLASLRRPGVERIKLASSDPVTLSSAQIRNARGPWRYEELIGYTSVGAGTCIADVRLNCPPEVTLHRLRQVRRADQPSD